MTSNQKAVIMRTLNDQINQLISFRDIRVSEKNWESVNIFNECIEEIRDAMNAFDQAVV